MILAELIDSAILKFKKRYPMQKVALELPDEVVLIPMDAILIEQVIVNILENAVQHAQGMTALTLRVFTLGNKAIFEIADNGCGIDPQIYGYLVHRILYFGTGDCGQPEEKRGNRPVRMRNHYRSPRRQHKGRKSEDRRCGIPVRSGHGRKSRCSRI